MAKGFVIVLEDQDEETVMRVLNTRRVVHEDLEDFLAGINGGDTGQMAHHMFAFLEESDIPVGMDRDVENWTFEQLKGFHRLARTNFDWLGVEVDEPHGWDPSPRQWAGILNNYPELKQAPSGEQAPE